MNIIEITTGGLLRNIRIISHLGSHLPFWGRQCLLENPYHGRFASTLFWKESCKGKHERMQLSRENRLGWCFSMWWASCIVCSVAFTW